MTRSEKSRSCDEIRAMLLDVVEGSLGADEERTVRAHVRECPGCAADLRALAAGWAGLPEARAVTPSAGTRHRVLARASGSEAAPDYTPRTAPWSLRRWLGAAALIMLATATGVGVNSLTSRGEAPTEAQGRIRAGGARTQLATGDLMPSFAAPDVFTGELLSFEALRGEVVLLNLWATWCLPCESEMPSMERLHRELGSRGLRIVALSIDRESTLKVRRWVEERGITFTVLHDSEGAFERSFTSSGVPETYVFDRAGTLVAHSMGPQRWDDPESSARLAALLAGGE